MTTTAATDSLIDLLAQKTHIRDVLEKDIAAVNEEIDAIERVLSLIAPPEPDDGPIHGTTKPDDIRDAGTHMAAAVIMAKMNRGKIRVTPAAKLIIAADLSDGKVSSVAATLHNRMTGSDDWEYTSPGTFRWKQYKTDEDHARNLRDRIQSERLQAAALGVRLSDVASGVASPIIGNLGGVTGVSGPIISNG